MKRSNSRKFGAAIEELASQYLIKKGFTVLERGYRYGQKEIDLICRLDNLIIFVEVKAARTDKFGPPETWVTKTKQRNIIAAAQAYIQKHDITNCDFRFDLISYLKKRDEVVWNHLEGAFDAEASP